MRGRGRRISFEFRGSLIYKRLIPIFKVPHAIDYVFWLNAVLEGTENKWAVLIVSSLIHWLTQEVRGTVGLAIFCFHSMRTLGKSEIL